MHYGCTALLQWGINESSDAIWSSVNSLYYSNTCSGGKTSYRLDDSNAGDDAKEGHPSQPKKEANLQRDEQAGRWPNRNRSASRMRHRRVDEAWDLLLMISELHQPQQAGDEGERPGPEEHSVQNSRDKVATWLQGR